ncbi:TPA: hypothetical protein ACIVBX_000551, partial [Salmonella enterica subsp. enterica serovar 1,4,5,12:b:-]
AHFVKKLINPPKNRDDGSMTIPCMYMHFSAPLHPLLSACFTALVPFIGFLALKAWPEGDKSAAQRNQTYSSREQ